MKNNNKTENAFDLELEQVKRNVHEHRQKLFPKGERPNGNKHWASL